MKKLKCRLVYLNSINKRKISFSGFRTFEYLILHLNCFDHLNIFLRIFKHYNLDHYYSSIMPMHGAKNHEYIQ